MRLGATIEDYMKSSDPEAYVEECRKQGYRAWSCPPAWITQTEKIRAIKQAFGKADIVIAEVGAWVNPLHPDSEKRKESRRTIAETLALADQLEAVCCGAVVGSFNGTDSRDNHVAQHPDNFTDKGFDAVVQWLKEVLEEVKPQRTKLTLEMSPWTLLDGPEVYLRLLEAVNHPGLAAHLDPANAVRDPRTYYSTTEMINRCFDLLGSRILSCHAKDLHYQLDARTVLIGEVPPGKGVLDYRTYLTRIEQLSPETPLIIEHLATEEEYAQAGQFIRDTAREIGATV